MTAIMWIPVRLPQFADYHRMKGLDGNPKQQRPLRETSVCLSTLLVRLRTMQTIDGIAATLSDPQLTVHWSCCNSSTEASCRVIITSQGYDLRVWHSFVIIIGVDSLKVIIKEGRVFFLSFEEKELQDFIMWQVSQHQISVSQNLARLMGWQIMSTSTAMGVSDLESSGTASSLILAAPNKERILAIKSGPSSGIKVFLQQSQKDNKNYL